MSRLLFIAACLYLFSYSVQSQEQWIEGVHYTILDKPISVSPEVAEFFSFWDPASFSFATSDIIPNIKSRLAPSVSYERVHVNYSSFSSTTAQDEATIEMLVARSLNLEDTLTRILFEEIHVLRNVPSTRNDFKSIFTSNAISTSDYDEIINSEDLNNQFIKNNQLATEYAQSISGVPTLIINGRYQAHFTIDMTPADFVSLVVWLSQQGFAENSSTEIIDLASLSGINSDDQTQGLNLDWSIASQSFSTSSTSSDLNGDGYGDPVICSPTFDVEGGQQNGGCFVLLGRDGTWPADFDILTLDGTNGFLLYGSTTTNINFGNSVFNAGDVNGDGIDDLLINEKSVSAKSSAIEVVAYVLFGNADGVSVVKDLTQLNGTDGFRIFGVSSVNCFGTVGDINNDSIDDIACTDVLADQGEISNAGEHYLIFGKETWDSSIQLPDDISVSTGAIVEGNAGEEDQLVQLLVREISALGDINGDGLDDIGIGQSELDDPVSSLPNILFGREGEWPLRTSLVDLNGSNGFNIPEVQLDDFLRGPSPLGDINGDGINDFSVYALRADVGEVSNAGKAYVIFGQSIWPMDFNLASLNGDNGFSVRGTSNERFISIIGLGDLNNDGFDDFAVNSRIDGDFSARSLSYVYFGRPNGWDASYEFGASISENNWLIEDVTAGDDTALIALPDFNGDGFDDVLVKRPGSDILASNAGSASIVLGKAVEQFLDSDGDGIPDTEDDDNDNDGMSNAYELTYGFNPYDASDADQDTDGDGLTNKQEFDLGTNPLQVDTDGDGFSDSEEALFDSNPLVEDACLTSNCGLPIWLWKVLSEEN